jgi:hypothetical protein
MKQEDRTFKMPTLPSPDQDPKIVNRQLIDAIKVMWIQLRDARSEVKSANERIDALQRKLNSGGTV